MQNDSLLVAISYVHSVTSFVPLNFGYDKLSKHPRTSLLPATLTMKLTSYHNIYSNQMNNTSYEGLSLYSLNEFRNYLIDYGFPLESLRIERPNDLSNLKHIINDIKFIGILRNTKYNRSVQLDGFFDAQKQVKKNLELINSYLFASE
jgi:hypothetical protein